MSLRSARAIVSWKWKSCRTAGGRAVISMETSECSQVRVVIVGGRASALFEYYGVLMLQRSFAANYVEIQS